MHALLEREMDLAGLNIPANQISTSSTFVTVAILHRSSDLVSLLLIDVAELFCAQKMLRILPLKRKSSYQTYGIVTRKRGTLSPVAMQCIALLLKKNLS